MEKVRLGKKVQSNSSRPLTSQLAALADEVLCTLKRIPAEQVHRVFLRSSVILAGGKPRLAERSRGHNPGRDVVFLRVHPDAHQLRRPDPRILGHFADHAGLRPAWSAYVVGVERMVLVCLCGRR